VVRAAEAAGDAMGMTCAICGWRDATGWTDYEGRRIRACAKCDITSTLPAPVLSGDACIQCGTTTTNGRIRCNACLKRASESATRRHQQRLAQGVCTRCSKPPMPGRKQCAECSERNRAAQARSKAS
jgi:hypothetical protein